MEARGLRNWTGRFCILTCIEQAPALHRSGAPRMLASTPPGAVGVPCVTCHDWGALGRPVTPRNQRGPLSERTAPPQGCGRSAAKVLGVARHHTQRPRERRLWGRVPGRAITAPRAASAAGLGHGARRAQARGTRPRARWPGPTRRPGPFANLSE